jgi:two-component system, NtrC family, sensor histidine kinase HydH
MLAAAAFRAWMHEPTLLRQFALLSLAVIALSALGLSLVISHALKTDLLEREWTSTADFVRTEIQQTLGPADFATPHGDQARARFQHFYQQTVMMPEIVRIKIYDADMRVIWSDEQRLIGQRFPDNPQLVAAIAGATTVNLKHTTGGENVYERPRPELVEVYVPVVFRDDHGVVGVVETYKEPVRVFANIRSAQITVVTTSAVAAAVLFLSLFWIVRRAASRIDAQHRSLERHGHELAAANHELRSLQAQLLRAERMAAIGEVVTAVAHGIRNPLANIRAAAQVALPDSGAGPQPQPTATIRNIIGEVDRLEGRVKELLSFVRPAETRRSPVDLNTLLAMTLRLLQGRFAQAGVSPATKTAPALPVVTADPMLIEQALVNIIGNAIDASRTGGTVTIATGLARGSDGPLHVVVDVHDDGPGIDPASTERIFELFYTTKAQGTGVGLPLARKFVEAHGGSLTVASRPGEGATFRMSLPAHSQA